MGAAAVSVVWPRCCEHLFHLSMEAPYNIWLWLAQWLLTSVSRVWMTDDGRTDSGARLYYKLTYEPKGSGELKIQDPISICSWLYA